MQRSPIGLGLVIVLSTMFAGLCNRAAAADPQPKLNFVFFLVDDLGWKDAGCQGSTFYETPAINALAADGMRFTQGYAACPVCSPTRASIVTGQYPARLRLTAHLPRNGIHLNPPQAPITVPHSLQYLPLEHMTIAEALASAGYVSGCIGKWHLGDDPFSPDKQGFTDAFGGDRYGSPPSFFYPYGLRGIDAGEPHEYLTDRLTTEAERFLAKHRDQPFFLYLSHYAVHTPIQAKEAKIAKYAAKADPRAPQHNAVYAAMIESVDDSLQRIRRKLKELDLDQRTVIFLTSDNGGLSVKVAESHSSGANTPATSNAPLRAGKGYLYEGGIRAPWIVYWPQVTPPQSECHVPVSSVDFFPTILSMAGVKAAADSIVDGEDLTPLLKQTGPLQREAIFWHYPHYNPQQGPPGAAIRWGKYKLIKFFEDDHVELYDLDQDIGETRNLAADFPEVAQSLRSHLQKWLDSVHADLPHRRTKRTD